MSSNHAPLGNLAEWQGKLGGHSEDAAESITSRWSLETFPAARAPGVPGILGAGGRPVSGLVVSAGEGAGLSRAQGLAHSTWQWESDKWLPEWPYTAVHALPASVPSSILSLLSQRQSQLHAVSSLQPTHHLCPSLMAPGGEAFTETPSLKMVPCIPQGSRCPQNGMYCDAQ